MYQIAVILLVVLARAPAATGQANVTRTRPRLVTVDAAFRYDGFLYLFSHPEVLVASASGREVTAGRPSRDEGLPTDTPIRAAVTWPGKPVVYYFGPDNSYRYNLTSRTTNIRPYARGREFLQHGGPDAAGFRFGRFYIFKGCQYVVQRGTLWHLGRPQHVRDLGLPCDIDAAWTDAHGWGMTILKGNKIWRWREELTGPHLFSDEYQILSWRLREYHEHVFIL